MVRIISKTRLDEIREFEVEFLKVYGLACNKAISIIVPGDRIQYGQRMNMISTLEPEMNIGLIFTAPSLSYKMNTKGEWKWVAEIRDGYDLNDTPGSKVKCMICKAVALNMSKPEFLSLEYSKKSIERLTNTLFLFSEKFALSSHRFDEYYRNCINKLNEILPQILYLARMRLDRYGGFYQKELGESKIVGKYRVWIDGKVDWLEEDQLKEIREDRKTEFLIILYAQSNNAIVLEQKVKLTPIIKKIISFFVKSEPGKTHSYYSIIKGIWPKQGLSGPDDPNLNIYKKRLFKHMEDRIYKWRKGDLCMSDVIINIPGIGYKIDLPDNMHFMFINNR